jgi:hypothetical protein
MEVKNGLPSTTFTTGITVNIKALWVEGIS